MRWVILAALVLFAGQVLAQQPKPITPEQVTLNGAFETLRGAISLYAKDQERQLQAKDAALTELQNWVNAWCGDAPGCATPPKQ